MGRQAPRLTQTEEARILHRELLAFEDGHLLGKPIPRDTFEGLLARVYEVGSRASLGQRIWMGRILGLWAVHEAHGKGGRGTITILPRRSPVLRDELLPTEEAVPA